MKTGKLKLAVMAGAIGLAVQANATLFDLSYSDPAGNTLTGLITASSIGGDEYQASAESLTLISPVDPALNGIYTLLGSNPAFTGPNNIFYYPGQPIVDWNGALVVENSSGTVLNLFSADANGNPVVAGAATYALFAYNGNYITLYPAGENPYSNVGGPATASLTPVPEPATLISGALMLLPFGASTLRILRRRQVA
jgi:hypothetical protein